MIISSLDVSTKALLHLLFKPCVNEGQPIRRELG